MTDISKYDAFSIENPPFTGNCSESIGLNKKSNLIARHEFEEETTRRKSEER